MRDAQDPAAAHRRDVAVRAWMDSAAADLAVGEIVSQHQDRGSTAFAVSFHAQQAAEKAVKALLVWHGVAFRPIHDLSMLLDRLPPEELDETAAAVADLTVFAVQHRYPAASHDPMDLNEVIGWPEAEDAMGAARTFVQSVRERLRASGWV